MIRSTFAGFNTAYLALMASQRSLDVTGQNLSNINTSGYTRQRLDLSSINPVAPGMSSSPYDSKVGQGVRMMGVSRIRDPFLDIQYRNQLPKTGTIDAMDDILAQIGNIFDETDKNAIYTNLGDVVSQLTNMATPDNAGSSTADALVRSACEVLLNTIHQNAYEVHNVREELINKLDTSVIPDINGYISDIIELNKSIKNTQVLGNPALELQDQRDEKIDALATYFPIEVKYKECDMGGGIIVNTLDINLKLSDGSKVALISDTEKGSISLGKSNGLDVDEPVSVTFTDINGLNYTINSETDMTSLSFTDDKGNLIDSNGMFVDSKGYLVDADGYLVEADGATQILVNGKPIKSSQLDSENYLIDETGARIDVNGNKLDSKGRLVDSDGYLVDAAGNRIKAGGTGVEVKSSQVDDNGYFVDESGYLLDENGQWIMANGGPVKSSYLNKDNELLDADGNRRDETTGYLLNAKNELVDKDGYYIDATGKRIGDPKGSMLDADGNRIDDATGYKLDENGYLVDADGYFLDAAGNRIADMNGNMIDADGYLLDANGDRIVGPGEYMIDDKGNFVDMDGNLLPKPGKASLVKGNPKAVTPETGTAVKVTPTVIKPETELTPYQVSPVAGTFRENSGKVIKQPIKGTIIDGVLKGDLDMLGKSEVFNGTDIKGIGYYEKWFDMFVNQFATVMNELNAESVPVDANGNEVKDINDAARDAQGNIVTKKVPKPLFTTTDGKTEGFTASNIKVSDDWMNGNVSVTISSQPTTLPGNDVNGSTSGSTKYENVLKMINALSSDDYAFTVNGEKIFEGTLFETYSNLWNTQAIERKASTTLLLNHETVLNQIADSKDSVSGVYMDEEVMNLMRFQQSYNAASRFMTTMDELLERLITGTGIVGR